MTKVQQELLKKLKAQVIKDGIASVRKSERDEKLEGGLEGFRLCESLDSVGECDQLLKKRREQEMINTELRSEPKRYWKYRYATIQVEYWREILNVFEMVLETKLERRRAVSGRAVRQYHKILAKLS